MSGQWSEKIADNRIDIVVRTGRPKTKVLGWDDDRKALLIDVAARPENSKANIEIVKFLSKETGRRAVIVTGKTSKKKSIRFS